MTESNHTKPDKPKQVIVYPYYLTCPIFYHNFIWSIIYKNIESLCYTSETNIVSQLSECCAKSLQSCLFPTLWTIAITFMLIYERVPFYVVLFLTLTFIYLATPGLTCGTWDFQSSLQHVGSLVAAYRLLLQHVGSSFLTGD